MGVVKQGPQKGSSDLKVGLDPRLLAIPKASSCRFGGDWRGAQSSYLAMSKCKISILTLSAPDPFKGRTELWDDSGLSVKRIETDSVTPWLGDLGQVL